MDRATRTTGERGGILELFTAKGDGIGEIKHGESSNTCSESGSYYSKWEGSGFRHPSERW